jgi:hypothetical protein
MDLPDGAVIRKQGPHHEPDDDLDLTVAEDPVFDPLDADYLDDYWEK